MASSSSTISNPYEPQIPFLVLNLNQCIKLTPQVYRSWTTQIEDLLIGFDLFKFVDGSHPCPSPTITNKENQEVANPAYQTWNRQDRLIKGAILGTIDPSITPLLLKDKTSNAVWTTLRSTYGNPSRSHILQVKERLKSISKGDKSATDYMQAIRTCTDELAHLGKSMDAEDIIGQVIEGLDYAKYKPVIDAVRARDTLISFDALHEKLLHYDLTYKPESPNITLPASVHYATNNRRSFPPNNSPGLLPKPSAPHTYNQNQNQINPPNILFKGRCQWCHKPGHFVEICRDFKRRFPNIQIPPMPRNNHQPQAHTATAALPSDRNTYLFDSGATHHITSDLNNLALHNPYDGVDDLIIGDGSSLPIENIGSFSYSYSTIPLQFNNVLHVPTISRNIISIPKLCLDNNVVAIFSPSSCFIKDIQTGTLLLQATKRNGLFEWSPYPPKVYSSSTVSLELWHHRLGHPSSKVLNSLSRLAKFSFKDSLFDSCNACAINKSHKLPFSSSSLSSTAPLQLIFSDVWTSPVLSYDSFKYYVIFVDHYTKYIWLYPLKRKSDTQATFIRFKALVEKFFNRPILQLYSDNGGEYIKLTPTLGTNGIGHLTSPPHTPEHNGYAERRHRHIVETGLALLSHGQLPTTHWPHAFTTAVYLINRMPTPTLNNESPYFKLFKNQPNYAKLRSFGCLCYPWLRPYTSHKLDSRSIPCVFVGYSSSQSAYHCLDPTKNRIYTSRHVQFVENKFPYHTLQSTTQSKLPSPSHWCDFSLTILSNSSTTSPLHNHTQSAPLVSPIPSAPLVSSILPIPLDSSIPPTTSPVQAPNSPNISTPGSSLSRTSSSSQESPSSDSSESSVEPPTQPPSRSIVTRLTNNIVKPNPKYAKVATLHPSSHTLPSTVKQALLDPRWRAAMEDEYKALTKNQTWSLVPFQSQFNTIGCKWVFRIKYKPDNTIDKYKARLVAKGFHQRPGLDYTATYSPVVKPATIRLLFSLALGNSWPLRHLDVNNAFLQGSLPDTVYMSQPPGFANPSFPSHVCKLHKAIYGLKQAPRAWFNELRSYLLSYGFTNSISDPSLFFLTHSSHSLYLLVYVDDIIVTGSSTTHLTAFLTHINNRFSLKDLGPPSYFLGVEVIPNQNGLLLTQTKYVTDLLARYKLTDCKPTHIPLNTYPPLTNSDGPTLANHSEYRAIIGSLQYLALTRPDISFPVNKLAQFLHNPKECHWSALKRLLRYLKGTCDLGLQLHSNSPMTLHAFCDADWAGDKDNYISTTGFIVYLGRNPISWVSRKQKTIARSSTEAEFRAIADVTAEIIWLRSLLSELRITSTTVPVIYCDNLGAKHYSENPVFHSRMKHVALSFHFVREHVRNNDIRIQHVHTNDQLADALTKPLPRPRFVSLLSKIGLSSGLSNLRGRIKDT